MIEHDVIGTLAVSMRMVIPQVRESDNGAVTFAAPKQKQVRLAVWYGVTRSDCDGLVDEFAKENGLHRHRLHAEWTVCEYI